MIDLPFIQARHYAKCNGVRRPKWVVLHSMEIENKPESAENVARYFANIPFDVPNYKKASAHICVDQNSAVRCVPDNDIAYAAPGSNDEGLHIELAEFARSSEGKWLEENGRAMLNIAAPIVRDWCVSFGIPMTFVDYKGLRRGEKGVTTHYEVSLAFGWTDHTDPGKGFPIQKFLAQVGQRTSATLEEAALQINKPAVKILMRPTGLGYWIIAADGGVFSFGDAPFLGSMGGVNMNADVVDAAVTPSGNGYMLLGADGGVFCFGDAQWMGVATEWIK